MCTGGKKMKIGPELTPSYRILKINEGVKLEYMVWGKYRPPKQM